MKILILLLFAPILCFAQVGRYDSLYQSGVISKSEYLVLKKSQEIGIDTVKQKVARYDSLFAAKQITESEYKSLKENLFKTTNRQSPQTSAIFAKARKQANLGAALTIVGSIFVGTGTAVFLASNSKPLGGVFIGLGVGTLLPGIGFLANSAVLKHKAKKGIN